MSYGVLSTEQTIKSGVPQGSVLGPWCYLVYSNDMPNCVTSCKMIMYADDTILLACDRNLQVVSDTLSIGISKCYHWLTNNNLSMHMGKTEAIVISSKRKQHLTSNFSVTCQSHTVTAKNQLKYLGICIDNTLSGENIVKSIVSKCSSRLSFL